MAWYLVPAGAKKNNEAARNRKNTLEKKYFISPFMNELEDEIQEILRFAEQDEYVYIWGAKTGPVNERTWSKLTQGDKVIFYAEESYAYLGVILATTRSGEIAEKIWPSDTTKFEFIYFMTDVQRIDISAEAFNAEFGYPKGPQGFQPIALQRIEVVSNKFGSIEQSIEYMANKSLEISEINLITAKEEAGFQDEVDNQIVNEVIEDNLPREIPPKTNTGNKNGQNKRDPKRAKSALVLNDYKCQFNQSHETFINRKGNLYMEAHHLVPMSAQKTFSYSLDVTVNIVSLCPNCHRAIHLGNSAVKERIIKKLFTKERKRILKKCGIKITTDELILKYT